VIFAWQQFHWFIENEYTNCSGKTALFPVETDEGITRQGA